MVLAGVFKLGRYTRFVSQSVMTGFLTGVAVNIIFGQLADLTGSTGQGGSAVARGIYVLLHPGEWFMPTLVLGLSSLAIVAWMGRTRFGSYAALVALVVPTVALLIIGTEGVATVNDVGEIPTGVPLPGLPSLSDFSFSLLWGALAIAAIVLVQGAGVSESAPNPDSSRSDPNRDFIAQGAGNIAASLFQGQPVGGSVGQTALNVSAGARDRWAAIFSGIWMAVVLVAFSGAVGEVVLSCLAGLLIYAAVSSIRFGQIKVVAQSGPNSIVAMVATFVATLFMPIAAAVGVGVVVSLLLQLNKGLVDLRVIELRRRDDGAFEEHPAPDGDAEPTGARDRCLRQPAVCRRSHAAEQAPRSRRIDATRGGPAPTRSVLAGGDVRGGDRRLREPTRQRRRASDPERGAEPDAGQGRAHGDEPGRRPHRGLRGHQRARRVDEPRDRRRTAVARRCTSPCQWPVGSGRHDAAAKTTTAPRPTNSRT